MRAERDADDLERLWAGAFGDEYVERNRGIAEDRGSLWRPLLTEHAVTSALEVGCNIGLNLAWIAPLALPGPTCGIDLNQRALSEMRRTLPGVKAVRASGRRLPFPDRSFDLVFTMGVLIHQAPEALPDVMREIVRCSRRYVLCCEYFAALPVETPYRDEPGSLFKRDFGALYSELFRELVLRTRGETSRAVFGDEMTYWLFEMSA